MLIFLFSSIGATEQIHTASPGASHLTLGSTPAH
jgi:hypothetical protein